MKLRLSCLLLCSTVFAAPSCDDQLVERWNRFAADANAYIQTVSAAGRADAKRAKQREKIQAEWEAVLACGCF